MRVDVPDKPEEGDDRHDQNGRPRQSVLDRLPHDQVHIQDAVHQDGVGGGDRDREHQGIEDESGAAPVCLHERPKAGYQPLEQDVHEHRGRAEHEAGDEHTDSPALAHRGRSRPPQRERQGGEDQQDDDDPVVSGAGEDQAPRGPGPVGRREPWRIGRDQGGSGPARQPDRPAAQAVTPPIDRRPWEVPEEEPHQAGIEGFDAQAAERHCELRRGRSRAAGEP